MFMHEHDFCIKPMPLPEPTYISPPMADTVLTPGGNLTPPPVPMEGSPCVHVWFMPVVN